LSPNEITEREEHWRRLVALLTLLAVGLFIASLVVLSSSFSADGDAELLRKVDDDSGTYILTSVLRALGSALLAVPLLYLFQAALARNDRMRSQFVGLVVAGPLFLAAAAIFTGLVLNDAAPEFVDQGVAGTGDRADNVAENAIEDSSLRGIAVGFGLAGALGFAFAMGYTCYQAMRVGLLSRFWGSLGAALGAASILIGLQLPLIFMAYLGVLIGGWVPGGRPPAWEEGKAVPWPTPGQRAAESIGAGDEGTAEKGEEGSVVEGEATEQPANPPRERGERRKRKRRQ
jgi:uncharacterized BrkB/YihY/UPF0761 family membrane protein